MRFTVVASLTALLLAAAPALASDQMFARSSLSHGYATNERPGWTPPAGMKPKPKGKRGIAASLDIRDE